MRDKDTLLHVRMEMLANLWLESQARTRTRLLPMALVCVLKHPIVVTLVGKESCLDRTLGSKMKLDSGRYACTVIKLGSLGQGVPRS